MQDEHPYYTEYHVRAFVVFWDAIKKTLSKKQAVYSKHTNDEFEYEDNFHMGIFIEAAASHLFIVSACTILESVIVKTFNQYGDILKEHGDQNHIRWKADDNYAYNPRVLIDINGDVKDKNKFIEGYIQLCEASNLNKYLDNEFSIFLKATIYYRNYIIHNGLEWGKTNINEFKARLGNKIIEKYFDKATSGNNDWVFTAKPETLEKLQFYVEAIIKGTDDAFNTVVFGAISKLQSAQR